MSQTTAEIQMHVEDGIRMYSVVRIERGTMYQVCYQDTPETAELSHTEIHDDARETRHQASFHICQGCAYRIGSMFDTHNAGKELYCGVLQDRQDGVD